MKSILVLPYEIICPHLNRGHNIVQFVQYFSSRDTQDRNTPTCKPCVSRGIPPRRIAPVMGFAIHFDDEASLMTVEIRDIGASRMLAAEFQTAGPLPERLPQQHFGQGHFPAQHLRAAARPLQHNHPPLEGEGDRRSRWRGVPLT